MNRASWLLHRNLIRQSGRVPLRLAEQAGQQDAQGLNRPRDDCSGTRWTSVWLAGLLALVPLASLAATSSGQAKGTLLLPVVPACVSSPFGPRLLPNRPLAGTFHDGIDLPAPIGTPVIAVAPGTVIRVQRHGIGGLELLIQHDGFIGVYSHLGLIAPILAEGGKSIYGGERIATVGRSGLTYGPHLYFGMIVDGRPVDPAPHLNVVSCGSSSPSAQDTRIRPTRLFAAH
jgi:murein DD-endopeptidase MepM/ murein hydrolase activator NlpD